MGDRIRGVCEHGRSTPHAVTEYTRSGLLRRSCSGSIPNRLPEIPIPIRVRRGGEK